MTLNEEREERAIAWKVKQAMWGDEPPAKISARNEGDLPTASLALQAMNEAFRTMDRDAMRGHPHDPSEYFKMLVWAGDIGKKEWNKQLEKDKKEGWKIISRTWCGVPYHEFQIPSLRLYKS
jgi:hypothetical protein